MQQKKQNAHTLLLAASHTGRLIKHPWPFLDHEVEGAVPISDEQHQLDVAALPTTHPEPISLYDKNPVITRSPISLTPYDYQQIDEEIEDTVDLSRMSTVQLMQLSGRMRAISMPVPTIDITQGPTGPLAPFDVGGQATRSQPLSLSVSPANAKPQPKWKRYLNNPIVKGLVGLAIGVLIILLMSRLIDFKSTAEVIKDHLTTPMGILHTCLAGLAFVAAFSFRGARWKFFLNRIERVKVTKVIRIYWIGVFINFLLPVQGGELAKSIMLKRVTGIPVSQSLPTVAMDKALDLMPVLFIIAAVPFIPGIHMSITLWLILGFVGSILMGLVVVVALTAWNRNAAMALINFFLRLLPKGLGGKIEGFAMGFVDSLLAGASRPKSFIPAIFFTALAISCEGLFAWEGFHAVGLNTMGLGIAIFGYTVYTLFSILPTPPMGVGTNEGAKTIVFVSLLGFNAVQVNAMAILVHPVCAVLMTAIGLISLRTLGLTLSSVLNKQESNEPSKKQEEIKKPVLMK